ncbi:GNAT family N-acetyltransferase [Psychrobacter piscatorii]|uniref:GNAT family N-acetyltransferase n=1 Tax=Psychrobacter piscatorii TaxID=554343 RepID=UPI001917D41B|nr:GNAT family N-acetyltransferase [Psychrobacter piscatorii]
MLEQVTLSSNGIILEPLTLAHATDLIKACQDGELWKINVTSVPEPDKVIDYINIADSMPDRQAFAVIDERTGKAIGSTSFHDILPASKRLEIGYTWYAKSYWRTHVNTTCKLMLLTYVFETLEYQTVGWRTDIDNHRSQQAIERLGAKKDGVIRGNRVRRDGVVSSTVMYSLLKSEWPQVKIELINKLNQSP